MPDVDRSNWIAKFIRKHSSSIFGSMWRALLHAICYGTRRLNGLFTFCMLKKKKSGCRDRVTLIQIATQTDTTKYNDSI